MLSSRLGSAQPQGKIRQGLIWGKHGLDVILHYVSSTALPRAPDGVRLGLVNIRVKALALSPP